METLYTAQVKTLGGRNGQVRSSDELLSLTLAFPKEMGGTGLGTNPEQLFAAGWSACFGQSLAFVASQRNIRVDAKSLEIEALVGVGQRDGGFHLQATLRVKVPGLPKDQVLDLARQAESVCAYSNAIKGNVPYQIEVVE